MHPPAFPASSAAGLSRQEKMVVRRTAIGPPNYTIRYDTIPLAHTRDARDSGRRTTQTDTKGSEQVSCRVLRFTLAPRRKSGLDRTAERSPHPTTGRHKLENNCHYACYVVFTTPVCCYCLHATDPLEVCVSVLLASWDLSAAPWRTHHTTPCAEPQSYGTSLFGTRSPLCRPHPPMPSKFQHYSRT